MRERRVMGAVKGQSDDAAISLAQACDVEPGREFGGRRSYQGERGEARNYHKGNPLTVVVALSRDHARIHGYRHRNGRVLIVSPDTGVSCLRGYDLTDAEIVRLCDWSSVEFYELLALSQLLHSKKEGATDD
jgi:hypothetical protein